MCTCGHDGLALVKRVTHEMGTRWLRQTEVVEGLALEGVSLPLTHAEEALQCIGCARARRKQLIGGGNAVGYRVRVVYTDNGKAQQVRITMTDVQSPACMVALVAGPMEQIVVPIEVSLFNPDPDTHYPVTLLGEHQTLVDGAVELISRAWVYDVNVSSDFLFEQGSASVRLYDRCLGTETLILTDLQPPWWGGWG